LLASAQMLLNPNKPLHERKHWKNWILSRLKHPAENIRESSLNKTEKPGDMILDVHNVGFNLEDGTQLFKDVTFTVNKGDKIAFISKDGLVVSNFFKILAGEQQATRGEIKWGITITKSYVPNDNSSIFRIMI
jgi:ATPase subunit of ABC transporter with duplicated ATPase domains